MTACELASDRTAKCKVFKQCGAANTVQFTSVWALPNYPSGGEAYVKYVGPTAVNRHPHCHWYRGHCKRGSRYYAWATHNCAKTCSPVTPQWFIDKALAQGMRYLEVSLAHAPMLISYHFVMCFYVLITFALCA